MDAQLTTEQSLYNALFGVKGIDHVISEPFDKSTILQKKL